VILLKIRNSIAEIPLLIFEWGHIENGVSHYESSAQFSLDLTETINAKHSDFLTMVSFRIIYYCVSTGAQKTALHAKCLKLLSALSVSNVLKSSTSEKNHRVLSETVNPDLLWFEAPNKLVKSVLIL